MDNVSHRRQLIRRCVAAALLATGRVTFGQQAPRDESKPDRLWWKAADAMKRLAESWGDQSYGAVLVLHGQLIGEGPSRVVKRRDPSAHAEREAIRDAQRRLGRTQLEGSVLYSTSRPCSLCEAAAAAAGVSRMYFGESMIDAGAPKA